MIDYLVANDHMKWRGFDQDDEAFLSDSAEFQAILDLVKRALATRPVVEGGSADLTESRIKELLRENRTFNQFDVDEWPMRFAAALIKECSALASRPAALAAKNTQQQQAFMRLLQAAKVYSFNYMQDEAENEEDCVCGPKQHAEAKEVFATIKEVEGALAATPSTQQETDNG